MSRLLDVHNFVADKLRWQAQVLLDGRLTANARMVGALIAHDLNVERGAAWRAQENMALALQVSLSSVRRGISELAKLGHLAVRKSCGRGKTQHYAALILDGAEAHDSIDAAVQARKAIGERVAPVTDDTLEKVAPVTFEEPEKVAPVNTQPSEKVAPVTEKGGAGERQTLEEPFNPPQPPSEPMVRDGPGEPGSSPVGRACARSVEVRRRGSSGGSRRKTGRGLGRELARPLCLGSNRSRRGLQPGSPRGEGSSGCGEASGISAGQRCLRQASVRRVDARREACCGRDLRGCGMRGVVQSLEAARCADRPPPHARIFFPRGVKSAGVDQSAERLVLLPGRFRIPSPTSSDASLRSSSRRLRHTDTGLLPSSGEVSRNVIFSRQMEGWA